MASVQGNPVGSLTQIQHEFVMGSILGDGTLRIQKGKKNALLEINHSIEQKEYVNWKYSQLKEYVLTPPKPRINNGKRIAYRFTTRSLPIFTEYYKQFYVNGKKDIRSISHLSPLCLAVWFMDDGCKSRTSLYLNTQQFSLENQVHLQRMFCEQWGILTTFNRDKRYYRMRIRVESVGVFKRIIDSYTIECMRYKFE